jgi:RNA ligase (TIGR02306 family)
MTRKMATIRRIDELNPIEGADKIEVATVGGWKVVCQKGLYTVDDLAVYCEIDSFIPATIAPFLTKDGHYPKTYEGVEGERLKTVKLRGQISQGLLLPLHEVDACIEAKISNEDPDCMPSSRLAQFAKEDDDVSELLGIIKYEPPVSAQLAGIAKGSFPSQIPKTDQERCQNLKREIAGSVGTAFEVTEKLDGSSMTVYLLDGVFGVCSRNLDLKESEGNTFWKAARELDLETKMRDTADNFAIQGELIGEGIQKNIYGIKGHEFHVYDMYDILVGAYMPPAQVSNNCEKFGLRHCPVLDDNCILTEYDTVDRLLELAEGKSRLNSKVDREGLVFKAVNGGFSFKAISNKFLMKHGD